MLPTSIQYAQEASTNSKADETYDFSVEGLQLVSLDWRLILVQVCKRVLSTVVVRIVVGINGLGLKTCDSIELLNRGSAQASESTKYSPLDFGNLRIFNCVDKGILGLSRMVLKLFGRVLFAEGGDLVEIHLQIVGHLLGQLILRSSRGRTENDECCRNANTLHCR